MRRRALRHVTFALGAAITALLLATAALSLVYTPRDPLKMSITGRLQGPSGPHPFGTDQYGRDVLSRVMRGTVTSIAVGVIAVGIGAALGMWIGILSGYAGGALDEGFMRLVDAIQGFPAILSALHLLALAIGLPAIFLRTRALKGPLDAQGLARVFAADSWWGIAALLWLLTGPVRAFGPFEKGAAFYLGTWLFHLKLGLFVLVFLFSGALTGPIVTSARPRRNGVAGRSR